MGQNQMIRTQARLFLKLIKPEESEINKNEESIAPTKIYRPKKKKNENENEAFSYRVKESKISVNLEQWSKSSESKTKSIKLSGSGRSAVELSKYVERSDEADEAEAHDKHDGRWDL